MKKIFILCFFLIFCSYAERFAVVDIVKLVDYYDKAREREEIINTKRKKIEQQLLSYKEQLEKKQKEFRFLESESQNLVLNESARKNRLEKARQIYKEVQNLQYKALEYQRKEQLLLTKEIQSLQNQTIQELYKFSQEKAIELGYDFVFPKKNLIFYKQKYDITQEVLGLINE